MLVIFPSAITEVCNLFKIPAYLRDKSSLLAALVPWNLSPNEMIENMWTQSTALVPYKTELDPSLLRLLESQGKTPNLAKKPTWAAALRLFKVTPEIYNFLTRSPRAYCMWHKTSDPKRDASDMENRMLVVLLDECRARNVGHKADVRVIFVHVGALETVRKLPAFAMRRARNPEIRIYSYGTCHSVPPERWGLREIYPIGMCIGIAIVYLAYHGTGGIVTFTVSAFKDDPFGLYRLVKLVEEHPLWMCYIHPYVLAALFKRDHPVADPGIALRR